jgi:hypothetical protein
MPDTPVVVYNRRLDILATNRLGSLVVADPTGAGTGFGNCVLATFLDPVMRRVYVDWDEVARDVVGLIRRIDGLVAELSARSEEFRTLWAAHDVRHVLRGRKRLRHPVVGEIALDYEHLALPDDPDLGMTVYTAPPRSEARRALDRLAAREAAGA